MTAKRAGDISKVRFSAAIYARVSTADQNCELQLRELREYCKRRSWAVSQEYVDTGWSGAKRNRPEFDRLKADAKTRSFDAVLVWKLDRFGRSLVHCLEGIEELRLHGIRFVAPSQNIDTDESNPTSRFMLHILAAAAEFEREMIRERVMAGLENAKAKGVKLGRKPLVFDRGKAHELRSQGWSIRKIAREIGASVETTHRCLKTWRPTIPAAKAG